VTAAATFWAATGEGDRVMAESLVPAIDIEPFLSGGAEAKARVAVEVDDALVRGQNRQLFSLWAHDCPATLGGRQKRAPRILQGEV
jgi:hypothetical protein